MKELIKTFFKRFKKEDSKSKLRKKLVDIAMQNAKFSDVYSIWDTNFNYIYSGTYTQEKEESFENFINRAVDVELKIRQEWSDIYGKLIKN